MPAVFWLDQMALVPGNGKNIQAENCLDLHFCHFCQHEMIKLKPQVIATYSYILLQGLESFE